MPRSTSSLLGLNVDKLFEDHKIEEIIEIEKLLDAEIERKRVELRSMVGDRYKDVLAASDAIKNMKTISQDIVENIQKITDTCEQLITEEPEKEAICPAVDKKESSAERSLIIQVKLAIFMNEQIWMALDKGDNLAASQYYLLAQHIHMGLSFSKKEYLDRLPLLQQIKEDLQILKDEILSGITQKLESVEINAKETSSHLNALLLLQNQSTSGLLNILIDHRKTALNTVMSDSHSSVRVQISAMVRCLITTIHLVHDCFICYEHQKKGLIWLQLESIVANTSSPTLSKLTLPLTPLNKYIPDVIRDFRPTIKSTTGESLKGTSALEEWLNFTIVAVKNGLENSLKLVTNIKGLHIIRAEAFKIELPPQWEEICTESKLPEKFTVWYYFFQNLITQRAKELISKNVQFIMHDLQSNIKTTLNNVSKSEDKETDLRKCTWIEESSDISRNENTHTGLSMKTLGYSQNVVNLCKILDSKYLELLTDASLYLYGKPFGDGGSNNVRVAVNQKIFVDREEVEDYLRLESTNNSTILIDFLRDAINGGGTVPKAVLCARFLQAVTNLCPNFHKCCTINTRTDDWSRICGLFGKATEQFWERWVDKCVRETDKEGSKLVSDINICAMVTILPKWDLIEIEEQTEEKVFKSQIKVPLKPSLILHKALNKLTNDLSLILPHTLPKTIHLVFIERNVGKLLGHYASLVEKDLNQNQALQFLFDVKFLTMFCIARDHSNLTAASQEICDKLRAKIDPFDLDVFYSHLQSNVKRAVMQSQVILGCLLPSSNQLSNLGVLEKLSQEKEPTIMALSIPTMGSWFPLLPISVPSQKNVASAAQQSTKITSSKPTKTTPKKSQDATAAMRSAAALFGGLTTDWFS